jgi:hypothetical protein
MLMAIRRASPLRVYRPLLFGLGALSPISSK